MAGDKPAARPAAKSGKTGDKPATGASRAAPKVGKANLQRTSAIVAHFQRLFGSVQYAYPDTDATYVHVDIRVIPPSKTHPHNTLFTTGMSSSAMAAPEPHTRYARAELVMTLPPTWSLDIALREPAAYWPLAWLRQLARTPFQHRTWLGSGHARSDLVDPARPRTTAFDGAWLLESTRIAPADARIVFGNDEPIWIWAVCPLFAPELAHWQAYGDGLRERFASAGVRPELVDETRKPVV